MMLMSSVMDPSFDIGNGIYQLRKRHHWNRPATAATTAAMMASTHQICSSSRTLNHRARDDPRTVSDARHNVATKPLGSSVTIITARHEVFLVAGESGTG